MSTTVTFRHDRYPALTMHDGIGVWAQFREHRDIDKAGNVWLAAGASSRRMTRQSLNGSARRLWPILTCPRSVMLTSRRRWKGRSIDEPTEPDPSPARRRQAPR